MITLTTEIFLHKFNKEHHIDKFVGFKNKNIKTFYLYDGTNLREDYLYIIQASEILEASATTVNCSFLCIGTPPNIQEKPCSIMYVSSKINIKELYNLTAMIFHEFNQFAINIIDIDNNFSLTQITEAIHEYLKLDIVISNGSFQVLAHSLSSPTPLERASMSSTYEYPLTAVQNIMKESQLENFETNEDFYTLSATRGKTPYFSILHNFKEYGTYIGAILGFKTDIPLTEGEKNLFELCANTIKLKFKRASIYRSKSDMLEAKTFLKNGIKNNFLSPSDLETTLKKITWELANECRVVIVNFHDYDSNTVRKYYENKIEEQYSNCMVLNIDLNLICIEKISETGSFNKDFIDILNMLLSDMEYIIGVSNNGKLSKLLELIKQGSIAIEQGKKELIDSKVFFFKNHIFTYLLNNTANIMSKDELCHQSLIILREYDLVNNSNLLDTLRSFFEHKFHIQNCANSLFIHRTTLLYRLKTIKKITDINLNDFRTRIYVGYSFFLLDDAIS